MLCPLPRGAVCWSAVCECRFSWSFSPSFFISTCMHIGICQLFLINCSLTIIFLILTKKKVSIISRVCHNHRSQTNRGYREDCKDISIQTKQRHTQESKNKIRVNPPCRLYHRDDRQQRRDKNELFHKYFAHNRSNDNVLTIAESTS